MHHSPQNSSKWLTLLFVLIMLLSRYLVCKNQKMSVSKGMVQCTERQTVEDFGVLRCDAVSLGARFSTFLPNVAKHSSSDSVESHTRIPDYR